MLYTYIPSLHFVLVAKLPLKVPYISTFLLLATPVDPGNGMQPQVNGIIVSETPGTRKIVSRRIPCEKESL